MKTPKHILVVISGKHTKHAALKRALIFAEFGQLHIHLFNSIYEPVMELTDVLSSDHRKELKKQYLADRRMYLDSLAEPLEKQGIKCTIHLTWHRELHEAIELATDEIKPDLVIKRISADATSINPFAMPIDRHLLRNCNAPLLLVNNKQWTSNPILAAVDPTTTDPAHMKLNHSVVHTGKMLSTISGSKLHAVNAYTAPNIALPYDIPNLDYGALKTSTENWHADKMQAFLNSHQLDKDVIHVSEGFVEDAIKKVSEQIEAQVLVIGTVGRTGLMGALIGNTADHILSKLTCEVLAIKS